MSGKIELAITQTHISTLQNIIARLSNYSMNCKTWAVTLVAALCVVLFDPQKICYFYIIFAPIVIFWLFDCYYLGLETAFRTIYDTFLVDIANENTNIVDDMKFSLKKKRLCNFFKAMFSISTTLLYVALAFVVFVLYFVIK
ncbi:MAG: hypothetical protein LBU51_01320 [Bacteroidales bacterium]|jgi:hypothetical protein|nr:hypothetical protein [Bacteroidales bacterium]